MLGTKLNPTPIRFPRGIVSELQIAAAKRGITKNKLVVLAVRQFLEQIKDEQSAVEE
jgi:hypothetical protein